MNYYGYKIYFWSNENNEPIHIHVSKGKPTASATKIWLTKAGGCVLANNNSKIPNKELNQIIETIETQYFFIVSQWLEMYKLDNLSEVKFYC